MPHLRDLHLSSCNSTACDMRLTVSNGCPMISCLHMHWQRERQQIRLCAAIKRTHSMLSRSSACPLHMTHPDPATVPAARSCAQSESSAHDYHVHDSGATQCDIGRESTLDHAYLCSSGCITAHGGFGKLAPSRDDSSIDLRNSDGSTAPYNDGDFHSHFISKLCAC